MNIRKGITSFNFLKEHSNTYVWLGGRIKILLLEQKKSLLKNEEIFMCVKMREGMRAKNKINRMSKDMVIIIVVVVVVVGWIATTLPQS